MTAYLNENIEQKDEACDACLTPTTTENLTSETAGFELCPECSHDWNEMQF